MRFECAARVMSKVENNSLQRSDIRTYLMLLNARIDRLRINHLRVPVQADPAKASSSGCRRVEQVDRKESWQ